MTELCRRLTDMGIPLQQNLPLSGQSSLRIGGNAAVAIFPTGCAQLLQTLQLTKASGIPYAVVGKGSNLLFPDAGYPGAVIFTGACRKIDRQGDLIVAEAGASLAAIARVARDVSLCGMEFAAGIPGSLGGAVFMNAGAFGGCMQQILAWSEYWDPKTDTCVRMDKAAHAFSTRYSSYQAHPERILLRAGLQLLCGDRAQIDASVEEYRLRRAASQPLEYPNAGSIFRHPPGDFAGRLIDQCRLKGTRIGGAEISCKHAGFIVNRGGATEQDVLQLIALIRARVLESHGVYLRCELRKLSGEEI